MEADWQGLLAGWMWRVEEREESASVPVGFSDCVDDGTTR